MDIDENRIDDAVLALLLLGLHDGQRAWKSFDWDALDRLHAKGSISDPVGKAAAAALRPPRWPACRRSIPKNAVWSISLTWSGLPPKAKSVSSPVSAYVGAP